MAAKAVASLSRSPGLCFSRPSTRFSLRVHGFVMCAEVKALQCTVMPDLRRQHKWYLARAKRQRTSHGSRKRNLSAAVAASRSGEIDMDALEDAAILVKGVLQEMEEHLAALGPTGELEELSVMMAASAAVHKRVDRMDFVFMLALDTMLMRAESEKNRRAVALLKIIKSEVLAALSKRFPPHVQVVEMLTRVPLRAVRKDILCMAAAGGGVYGSQPKELQVPAARLQDIIKQADDLIFDLEERPQVPDRKLLARLILIREEGRGLLAGGLWDERSDLRPLSSLPETEVQFLGTLASLQPGPLMRQRLKDVMSGMAEGQDRPSTVDLEIDDDHDQESPSPNTINDKDLIEEDHKFRVKAARRLGWGGPNRPKAGVEQSADQEGVKDPLPVRPGLLLDAIRDVLKGAYGPMRARAGDGGMVYQLQWVQKESMQILEDLAGWSSVQDAEASTVVIDDEFK